MSDAVDVTPSPAAAPPGPARAVARAFAANRGALLAALLFAGVLLAALLAEQRRTNRLLQSLIWGGVGFVLGALVAQFLARWHGW